LLQLMKFYSKLFTCNKHSSWRYFVACWITQLAILDVLIQYACNIQWGSRFICIHLEWLLLML
jgi:hypothetical protein